MFPGVGIELQETDGHGINKLKCLVGACPFFAHFVMRPSLVVRGVTVLHPPQFHLTGSHTFITQDHHSRETKIIKPGHLQPACAIRFTQPQVGEFAVEGTLESDINTYVLYRLRSHHRKQPEC